MNSRDLNIFLILQVMAIAVAGLSFSVFSSRLVAGSVAGGYFIASGLYMVFKAYAWDDKWRSLMWYPLLTHVFVISIPMVVTRFLQTSAAFHEIKIWGLQGPQFHKLSTLVFSVLVLSTLVDAFRARKPTQ